MNSQHDLQLTTEIQDALNELQVMIATKYPEATFVIQEGSDPPGIYLLATVDVSDTDDVFAVVVDRLVDMQVEEGLPVYVVTLRPLARVIAELREQQTRGALPLLPTG
jgi:hypothetical protein